MRNKCWEVTKLILSNNWVGKSSDFTNPFVCGPRRGESEKMRPSVTYVVSDTLFQLVSKIPGSKIPNFFVAWGGGRATLQHLDMVHTGAVCNRSQRLL